MGSRRLRRRLSEAAASSPFVGKFLSAHEAMFFLPWHNAISACRARFADGLMCLLFQCMIAWVRTSKPSRFLLLGMGHKPIRLAAVSPAFCRWIDVPSFECILHGLAPLSRADLSLRCRVQFSGRKNPGLFCFSVFRIFWFSALSCRRSSLSSTCHDK